MNRRDKKTNHWVYCCLSILALSAGLLPEKAQARSGVGINISEASYWGRELKFTNMMKAASGNMGVGKAQWMTRCNPYSDNDIEKEGCTNFRSFPNNTGTYAAYNTGEQDKLQLDELNYPLSLPAPNDRSMKFRSVSAIVLHPSAKNDAGQYTVLYDGQGTLSYAGVTVVSSKPGRDVVKYTAGNEFDLFITATTPGNHIRNIRIIPPGGACSNAPANFTLTAAECTGTFTPMETYAKTHTFHPRFTADLKGMRIIRFMDAMQINRTDVDPTTGDPRHTLVNWNDRAKPASVSYTEFEGFPFPTMLDLTEEVGADPWINIGYRASDEVATNLGKLLAQRYKAGTNYYIEYGNEPWNTAGPFYGNYLYLDKKAHERFKNPDNQKKSQFEHVLNYYALRSSEICKLIKAEMGTNASAVKCVLNNQQGFAWQNEETLLCPMVTTEKLLNGKPCADIMDISAIAPYFGGEVGNAGYKDKNGRTVKDWLKDPDGGLQALFQDAEYTQLPQALQRMKDSKAVADKYGKPMMTYEGGQHYVDTTSNKNVQKLFETANRDSRMGTMYTKNLNDWKSTGAQAILMFTNVGAYGSSGYWGLRENMNQRATPKFDAVKTYNDTVVCWWGGC
jgi:hypothetical protein